VTRKEADWGEVDAADGQGLWAEGGAARYLFSDEHLSRLFDPTDRNDRKRRGGTWAGTAARGESLKEADWGRWMPSTGRVCGWKEERRDIYLVTGI
jgi:hypothetical protein